MVHDNRLYILPRKAISTEIIPARQVIELIVVELFLQTTATPRVAR